MKTKDLLIEDFTDVRFERAFKTYFNELGVNVTKWDELLLEMNDDPNGKNYAWLRLDENDEVVGFIQFTPMPVESWFFETTAGFIREFWVSEKYRAKGQGRELLCLAEQFFTARNISISILTTDTAEKFYEKHGYHRADMVSAKNHDCVLVKVLTR